jgi:Cysteine-rich CPXCG
MSPRQGASPGRSKISGETLHGLETSVIQCPYCGEQIEMVVDCSIPHQEYVEDCGVCCRPITISVVSSDGEVASIEGRTESD